jgi:phage tail-like protein
MPLLRTFQFEIKLRRSAQVESGRAGTKNQPLNVVPNGDPLGDGGFQECTGLEIEMDVQDYFEGGRNDGVIRRVGRAKYPPLILKRGIFYGDNGQLNQALWRWIQGVVEGRRPVARYDGLIEVMSVWPEVAARWEFYRGLPAKITGPQLNAKTGDIALEELHIAHEGLRLAP